MNMENFFIAKPHCQSHVIERSYVDEPGLRIFKNSPFDVIVQIRTRTEKQGRMSNVYLSRAECLAVAEQLKNLAMQLQDEVRS